MKLFLGKNDLKTQNEKKVATKKPLLFLIIFAKIHEQMTVLFHGALDFAYVSIENMSGCYANPRENALHFLGQIDSVCLFALPYGRRFAMKKSDF